jgi:UDP-N-acetylglucosamine acyltransferase
LFHPVCLKIHSSAVVDPRAELGEDVEIGPLAIIEAGVRIGRGCTIRGHAQLVGRVTLGEGCEIGHGAILGADPQDLGFDRRIESGVTLGSHNVIREHVTIHRSTRDGGATTMGDRNLLMVGCHLGHDVEIGSSNILANGSMLGGHVHLGSGAFLGGGTGVHQFVRLGDRCMAQGHASISQDVPPFVLVADTNRICGLNVIGMRRAGFTAATRANVKEAFHRIYLAKLNLKEALESTQSDHWVPEALAFIDFFRVPSKRGVCHP